MNRKLAVIFAGGILMGVAVAAALGAVPRPYKGTGAVDDLLFPRRQEGIAIAGSGVIFAGAETELEDLPPFPELDESRTGRFEAIALGGGEGGFLILDTQTGLVQHFTPDDKVRLYNARVPNHAIEAPVRTHFFRK